MKAKLAVAAVLLALVGAQWFFGGRVDGKRDDAPIAVPPAPPAPAIPVPEPGAAAELLIGPDGDAAVSLRRDGEFWRIDELDDALAEGRRVERVLAMLLEGRSEPAPESLSPGDAGLGNGRGVRVAVIDRDGDEYAVMVGRRPEGRFDAAYVQYPDGGIRLLLDDIRAAIGLWDNVSDSPGGPEDWLERTVVAFDAARAASVVVRYPDHRMEFVRGDDGGWEARGYVPGGEFSRGGLERWLEDVSSFRVSGLVGGADPGAVPLSHRILVRLDDGREMTVDAGPGDNGMLAIASGDPDRVYALSDWRFRKYFLRMADLFPAAAPSFDAAEVRLLDLRRDGESVKILRRDGDWHGVALPWELRRDAIDRFVRFLSLWRPEDYADPDAKGLRHGYGGPVLDVILATGAVHRYRLAGRHPLFPWRYVTLDGGGILSAWDGDTGMLFPSFADLLLLGRVFAPVDGNGEDLSVRLDNGSGERLLSLVKSPGNVWTAANDRGELPLEPAEGEALADELLSWDVAGISGAGDAGQEPMCRIRVESGGRVVEITLLHPPERDIPYHAGDGRRLLVDRGDFFNWVADAKALAGLIDAKVAAEEAAAATEATGDAPGSSGAEADSPAVTGEDAGTPDAPVSPSDVVGDEEPAASPVDNRTEKPDGDADSALPEEPPDDPSAGDEAVVEGDGGTGEGEPERPHRIDPAALFYSGRVDAHPGRQTDEGEEGR